MSDRTYECPYLINAWRSSVSCSGIVKGSSTLLRFDSGEDAKNGNVLFVRGLINVDMIVARIISCFRNSDARTQAKIIFM